MNHLRNAIASLVTSAMASGFSTFNSAQLDLGLSTESLDQLGGSVYQAEIACNRLLPYADKLDERADGLLAQIKAGLGKCIILRDINPGCLEWCRMLNMYIRLYGLRFTKDEHIAFIKLFYQLVTLQNLEPVSVSIFAKILILLLKKKETISPKELELPWRPLYDLCKPICTKSENLKTNYLVPMDLKNVLEHLVQVSKIYFPVKATQEILDELKPKLYPHDYKMVANLKLLRWFLPVQLFPEQHSIGHQLWFHEFMQFWETYHYVKIIDNEMMHIMAKLAFNNIGCIDWNPYIPIMFTRFLTAINLPVSYKKNNCRAANNVEVSHIAEWIASVLGDQSDAQVYLDKFLKTVETYFHPANSGSWSMKLSSLFSKITHFVTLRIHRERYKSESWETPIKDDHKLSDENIDTFVTSMMPIAIIAIYNPVSGIHSHNAIQNLANMRPKLVIPKVLEKLLPVLDVDTERHKLSSAFSCMTVIARPLAQGSRFHDEAYAFTEGPTYILQLLFAALSGLNPNEPGNSLSALNFIRTCVLLTPIVDCSKVKTDRSETDHMICEETARFEDFTLQFMDRIFTLIKSVSQELVRIDNHNNAVKKDYIELMTEQALSLTFTSILTQSNDAIFISMLNKLRSFIIEENLEIKVAGELVGTVCNAFSRRNGTLTLKTLLPHLTDKIIDYIRDHTVNEEQSDNQLLYSMLLLEKIVDTQCHALLPYIEVLTQVLDNVVLLKCRESNVLGCETLKILLKSLCEIKTSGLNDHFNNSEHPHWKDWGQSVDIESVNLNWHVPGEREFTAAQNLFERYFVPSIESIQNYVNGSISLSRDELQRKLRIIESVVKGCNTILPMWEEDPLLNERYKLCTATYKSYTGVDYEIKMPDGANVRRLLVQVMAALQEIMLKTTEDDTKSLLLLLEIWQKLDGDKSRWLNQLDAIRGLVRSTKQLVQMEIIGNKDYVPLVLVLRTWYQQEFNLASSFFPLTQTGKNIILNLFQLNISNYSEVRSKAQNILKGIFEVTPYSEEIVVPLIVEVLQRDTEIHHDAYKGVLYLLNQTETFIKSDWRILLDLLPAMVSSKPTEKPSAIHQQDQFVMVMKAVYSTMNITLDVPDSCVAAASELWNCGMQPKESQPTVAEVKKGLEDSKARGQENLQAYNSILDKLITIASDGKLHWRHRQIATQFVSTLAHPDYPLPPKVVRYFLNALIHDLIDERKMAWTMMIQILYKQKRKHKKIIIDAPNRDNSKVHGFRPDNEWLQYSPKNWPTTAKEWEEPRYVHKEYVGFYGWPKQIEMYAPTSEQPSLDRSSRKMSEQEKEVDAFFSDAQNVNQLIQYCSLEEKKNKDQFNVRRSMMFQGLFRNHGDDHLGLFLLQLEMLLQDGRESAQRCAAELVTGLVRGTKHWPFQKTEELWRKLLPLIRLAIDSVNMETLADWSKCFSGIFEDRDPNRLHWLVECLVNETLRDGRGKSSINEQTRLRIFRVFARRQFWRVSELVQGLLPEIKAYLYENPLMGVRDELAQILAFIFYANDTFRKEKQTNTNGFSEIDNFIRPDQQLLEDLLNENSENGRKFLHSLCTMIRSWIVMKFGISSSFYKLYPTIIRMENSENLYPELAKSCTRTLAFLAIMPCLPKNIPAVLDAIKETSNSKFRLERISSVQFLEVVIFHNMNILMSNGDWIDQIRSVVLKLLEDESVEVREKAAEVLTGMIHCTLISDRQSLLNNFVKMAKEKRSTKQSTDPHNVISVRHAGVLGMCAFIKAHPYDIPQDIPPLFEHLSVHLSDPHPIPATVRKTLCDFKRTHCDTTAGLQGLAEQLTREQFELLQDLDIPPSYFT